MDYNVYLDNIIYGIQKYGGVTTYWKGIQKYFITFDNVRIIAQSKDQHVFDWQGNEYDLTRHEKKFLLENTYPIPILRCLPLTKRLPAGSLYHASYYRTCLQNDVVNIITVHDFTRYKGYSTGLLKKLAYLAITNLGIRNADGIICISESTRRDLLHYFPQIPENKIRMIYHGINEDFYPLEKIDHNPFQHMLSLEEPYVVFIGNRRGYKNFDIVPEALKQHEAIKLVIIGGEPLSASEIKDLERNLPGRYIKIDSISNDDLNILYNKAFSLLYPSDNEGFGFPVAEAMRAGCPVITSNHSSIPEVGGDAVLMLDEISPKAIAQKIDLLQEPAIRCELIKKGFQQSKKFTWKKCFSETLEFYREIHQWKFGE